MSAGWKQKRFWTSAEPVQTDAGWGVALDGRPVKTPAKAALVVPTRAMAEAIAAEWNAQDGEVQPLTMPVTRAANAAIDKVSVQRAEVAAMLAAYGDSDLLCYRAESPAELVARQAAAWDPLLDWAASRYGARLSVRTGLMHSPQDPEALERLAAEVQALDPFRLTGFHDLVAISGSLVLGLAVLDGRLASETAWDLSRIDEAWQAEQWGEDEEAAEMAAHKRDAFCRAEAFLRLAVWAAD